MSAQSISITWFLYDRNISHKSQDNNIFLEQNLSLQLTPENSNTQFLELFDSSSKFFGPLNITHFFRQKNSQYLEYRYLEYLGRSNKIVGPLDDSFSFFRTFFLTFRPKFESSIKFGRFIRFFGKKKCIAKVFSISSDVFL